MLPIKLIIVVFSFKTHFSALDVQMGWPAGTVCSPIQMIAQHSSNVYRVKRFYLIAPMTYISPALNRGASILG